MTSDTKRVRLDGYIRVSRVGGRDGDAFISPEVQRDTILSHARAHGHEVIYWEREMDQSGGKLDRPKLKAILERIEAGETDGIAVAKLDRLSRLGVGDALKLVEDIQNAGGVVVAVDLGLDPTTVTGELTMTILLALARMERRRLSDSWETAKDRAMDRHVKIGPTPFGYQRCDDGRVEPDPDQAPIVREAFRLAAERGLDDAVAYLDGLGIVHTTGKRSGRPRAWTTSTVRRLLANRSYLGENIYGDRIERDAHDALVTRAIWEAAQPDAVRERRPKSTYPLSGLAKCGTCGEAMTGGTAGGGIRTYRCRAAQTAWKGDPCPGPAMVVAERLEEHVRVALLQALTDSHAFASVEASDGLAEAEEVLQEAERELDDFLADTANAATLRRLGRFDAALSARTEAVEVAQARYRETAGRTAATMTVNAADLVDGATAEELGELTRGTLDAVVVARGRGALDDRVRLVSKGAPADAGVATA